MTEMFQKTENVANFKMQHLTEQWKKGELPYDKSFYVKTEDNCYYDIKGDLLNYTVCVNGEEISEVLAPVPSYEEWQLMQDDNKRLKHDVGNLGYKIKNQRKEIERQIAKNAQLKELLAECESSIQYYQETYGAMDLDTYTLLAKLKEVLK